MTRRDCGLLITVLCCCSFLQPATAQPPDRDDDRAANRSMDGPPAPEELEPSEGLATIPDHATYQRLSYKGNQVMIDTFLAGLEFVKFTIADAASDAPKLYFINTVRYRAHPMFGQAIGLGRGGRDQMKGVLVYRPRLKGPDGTPGLYTFEFEPNDSYDFDAIQFAHDLLVKKAPFLKGKIGYYPRERGMDAYERDKSRYAASDIEVYRDEDLNNEEIVFLPVNPGKSFGRLRLMTLEERPSPRDIVLYTSLPNELPRVAGIITAVRQTPLSHVNLRAVQDGVPNAFIAHAATSEPMKSLLGKFVTYQVTNDGYELHEATQEEVETHFARLRPSEPQTPPRDLSVTTIRPLDEIKFEDARNVGVKAANIAVMRTFEFPEYVVPDGKAIPFYFYDEFMKHNGLYEKATAMLSDESFRQNTDLQVQQLETFQKLIEEGSMPDWMMSALQQMQESFPSGTSLRCRSSTNNEDLAGFSGAGLYDSFTHKPSEGHIAKTIKQVYASMWNFRAFEERDFYRVDHLAAAMGVLVHPNFKGELANGVAVTEDILYETQGFYYVNVQVGEDLVTNPNVQSIPEEVLLGWYPRDGQRLMQESNRVESGKRVLSDEHQAELRGYLARIHSRFAKLYGHSSNDRHFAMEIEFKVTKEGKLSIKQARPWVFPATQSAP